MPKDTLPKQVRAQAEQAEALEQALAEEKAGEQDQPDTKAVADQAEAVATVKEPAGDVSAQDDTGAPEAPEDVSIEKQLERAEQRYKTLQGMFNKEQSKSREDIAALTEQVKQLTEQLTEVPSAEDKALDAAAATTDPLVTDKDVDDYGADMVDLVRRAAMEVVQQSLSGPIAALEQRLTEITDQMGGVTATQRQSTEREYFAELERVVPDYRSLNESPEFLAWLGDIDPVSGVQRQAYLNNAYSNANVEMTAALFDTYKREAGLVNGEQQAPAQQVPSIERQLQPESSTVAEPTNAQSTRVWSTSEIDKFYQDKRRKQYTEEQAARIESEIDAAVQTGRIRAA